VAVLGPSSELSLDSAPSNLEFFKYFVGVTLEATWALFDGLDGCVETESVVAKSVFYRCFRD
jgi:hypothetical protein